MRHVFNVSNVNHAIPVALAALRENGLRIAPRGQPTRELPGVVSTVYHNPEQMVLFDPIRDANPFFHFFEALWILRGRSDVKFLAHFNARMADFSDDGIAFHAPYGYRLRSHFQAFDQIEAAISKLREDPDSRQAVLTIWDPHCDWERTKDVPCNDMIMLKVREGKLRMVVCNRSNDVIWGAYGANVVQFSTLLVYLARRIGVRVGQYTQMSDSFHVYEDNPFWIEWLRLHQRGVPPVDDPYGDLGHYQEFERETKWMSKACFVDGNFDEDLRDFFTGYDENVQKDTWYTQSFEKVVWPMWLTHRAWKNKNHIEAMAHCTRIEAPDWRLACRQWMQRRIEK